MPQFAQRTDIEVALRSHGLPYEWARLLAAKARPAAHLISTRVKSERDIPIGASKLGGLPDLPREIEWPWRAAFENVSEVERRWSRNNSTALSPLASSFPLGFVAQIDCATLSALDLEIEWLPKAGRISLFYDRFQATWGFNPSDSAGFRVIFNADPREALERKHEPAVAIEHPDYAIDEGIYPPSSLVAERMMCLLPMETAEFDRLELPVSVRDAYSNFLNEEIAADVHHRFGGWPVVIQNDMQVEAELISKGISTGDASVYQRPDFERLVANATDWSLLLQIDTDENSKMMWGDAGSLYVWAKQADLLEHRFEKSWLIFQCC